MESDEVDKAIDTNRELANSPEIERTPAFVIGEALVPEAVNKSTLVQLIQETRIANGSITR